VGDAGSSPLAVFAPDEAEPLVALVLDEDELPIDPPAWLDASGPLVSFVAAAAAATLAIRRSFLSSLRTI
jgi:hypothetical protein